MGKRTHDGTTGATWSERTRRRIAVGLVAAALAGCGGGGTPLDAGVSPDGGASLDGGAVLDGGGLAVPATYAFESRFAPGQSSVAYGGQVARGLLAAALVRFVEDLDGRIATGAYAARDLDGDGVDETLAATVLADLEYFFGPTAAERAADPHGTPLPSGLSARQRTWGELSETAFLLEKVAGNDSVTDHRDWSRSFRGFSAGATRLFRGESVDVATPTGLLRACFTTLAANAEDAANGVDRLGPDGARLPVHVTVDGVNLAEFVEKILLGGLVLSQGADDYLDDDVDGKGLRAPNTRDGTNPYTTLEHAWDEAFGYFGAPRHGAGLSLEALTGDDRAFDADGDAQIDFTSEYLFPAARYAAQRDLASAASSRTAFFADADRAFRTGRAIIAGAGETLTADEAAALAAERDAVILAWERGYAATTIHYLNAVIGFTLAIDASPSTYVFEEHAGEWSEMKGFALAFQFSPDSPMGADEGGTTRFEALHALLGDAPVLSTATPAERAAYVASLREARALLGRAYGFDAANLGGEDGTGGW